LNPIEKQIALHEVKKENRNLADNSSENTGTLESVIQNQSPNFLKFVADQS